MSPPSSVLAIRDFRLAVTARLADMLGAQMLSLAVAWQIFQLTGKALPLGLIGLAEGLPFMAAALWAGRIVDQIDKKTAILAAEACILCSGVGLGALANMNKPPLWTLYACLAVGGLGRSLLFPAQSAYIQMKVPREIFPKAAAWTTGVLHASAILGPSLGGFLYDARGAGVVYACSAACFVTSLLVNLRLATMPPAERTERGAGLEELLSGAKFVWGQKVMLGAMSLDMFGVFFGGVDGVMPMFAARLGATASGLGILSASTAAGALATSLVLAHHRPFQRTGKTFVACVALFGLSIVAFAFSRRFWLSCGLLAFGGAADCVGMVLRSSMYQALTPDGLRGRVSAVNGLFIRTSNEIGAFESGLAASVLGLVPSAVFGGCMTLASVAVALLAAPELPSFDLAEAG